MAKIIVVEETFSNRCSTAELAARKMAEKRSNSAVVVGGVEVFRKIGLFPWCYREQLLDEEEERKEEEAKNFSF